MAWTEELPARLRYFINDLDSPPNWTDTQLQNFIALSIIQTSSDISQYGGMSNYTLTMASGVSLSPDPVDEESDVVLNLVLLKAAYIISNAELKKIAASAGIKITDDRSTIDTSSRLSQVKTLVNTYLDMYNEALNAHKFNTKFSGSSILAPYADANGSLYPVPLYGRSSRYC